MNVQTVFADFAMPHPNFGVRHHFTVRHRRDRWLVECFKGGRLLEQIACISAGEANRKRMDLSDAGVVGFAVGSGSRMLP